MRHVTTIVQVNTGRRSIVMPGARRATIVASWQAARRITPVVAHITPAIHRSIPDPGVFAASDIGNSAVHAADAAPSRARKLDHASSPPKANSQ
jgi:hypothetical protein